MGKIHEKYERLRSLINDGDIILFTGNTIVSKIIRNFDNNSDWSHVEIITKTKEDRLLVQGANLEGVHPEYLSHRLKFHTDFLILRPIKTREEIDTALCEVFSKVDMGLKYDYDNGFKELLNRKFKMWGIPWTLKIKLDYNEFICSTFAAPYAIRLGLVSNDFINLGYQFPQDFIRYMISDSVDIIN